MLWHTDHDISKTIMGRIGASKHVSEWYDAADSVNIAYGILRGTKAVFCGDWFEIDKGMWGAGHYDGLYRMSYKGTQPIWREGIEGKPHGLTLEPWRTDGNWIMICPPTDYVCSFFDINYSEWMLDALRYCRDSGKNYGVRYKGAEPYVQPIDWDNIYQVYTFNSSLGIEALRRGIPVISDPIHSSIGSYCAAKNTIDGFDRNELLSFISSHQFKLMDRERVWEIASMYLSVTTAERL